MGSENKTVSPPLSPDSLARLEAGVWDRQGRKEGAEICFLCPAHDDHDPSARYNLSKALWWCPVCGAGGGALSLARSLGLELPQSARVGLTVDELAEAKGLPAALLRELGVQDGSWGRQRQPCVDIPYCDERGELRAVRKRLSLHSEPRFQWRRGDKVLPYGLPRLTEARASGRLLLVEGESDCWTLWQAGIPTLGVPGASTWRSEWITHLEGTAEVYVWREPDSGGDTLAAKVAQDLPDVLMIDAPTDAKDPSALYLQGPAAFLEHMRGLMEKARPASSLGAEALSQEARECWEKAQPLLDDPTLLDRVGEAIRRRGYAGDLNAPLLAYVALTSRLLGRPLNLAFVAPSAAGKNRAVDAALELVPATAYHLEKAGSARALIYDDDGDYQHRTVVVAEADSIPEEGPAASAIRALAADNEMSYDVVEKDPETGRQTTRHILKPGPTGLITTSTKPLGEQMGTRLLTVGVSDTPEQTRAVLLAHAADVNRLRPNADVAAFVASQRWLELAGDREVAVPFAHALAEAVPADLVRMRRDFRQLLTVIEAVALLYQCQRGRDVQGRIVTTLEDYRMARSLLLDVFTAAATGGVSRTVRETVHAVQELYDGRTPVSVAAVADRLRLHRSAGWRRAQEGVRLGFVRNLETRKGQPAKLVPGDTLPEDKPALPEASVMCCEVDHPESSATVQPDGEARGWPESEASVAQPVALPLQPGTQPVMQSPPDTDSASKKGPVARLHTDLGDVPSHTSSSEPGPVIDPLADYASRLAPCVRLTVHETEDIAGDVAFLRCLRLTIEEYPGANLVVATIRTLAGRKVRAEWRALASSALRRRLGEMLRERARDLGLIVDRRTRSCRRCRGNDLAHDTHGRLFCRACRPGRLRGGS